MSFVTPHGPSPFILTPDRQNSQVSCKMDTTSFQRNPTGYSYTLGMTAFLAAVYLLDLIVFLFFYFVGDSDDRALAMVMIFVLMPVLKIPELVYTALLLAKPSFLYSGNTTGKLCMSIPCVLLSALVDLITLLCLQDRASILGIILILIVMPGHIMMIVTFVACHMAKKGSKLAWMLPYTAGTSYGGSIYGASSYSGGYGGGYGQQSYY